MDRHPKESSLNGGFAPPEGASSFSFSFTPPKTTLFKHSNRNFISKPQEQPTIQVASAPSVSLEQPFQKLTLEPHGGSIASSSSSSFSLSIHPPRKLLTPKPPGQRTTSSSFSTPPTSSPKEIFTPKPPVPSSSSSSSLSDNSSRRNLAPTPPSKLVVSSPLSVTSTRHTADKSRSRGRSRTRHTVVATSSYQSTKSTSDKVHAAAPPGPQKITFSEHTPPQTKPSNQPLKPAMAAQKVKVVVFDDDDALEETEESSPSSSQDETCSSDEDQDPHLSSHLRLLERRPGVDELNEIKATPLFTEPVRKYAHSVAGAIAEKPFSQYGLLAGDMGSIDNSNNSIPQVSTDPRIFWNIAAPSSFFICGSQGSGKSHTLSCLLENALAPCDANVLPRPLTGIVFHYDTFISDTGGSPCEAAWLSSNPNIKVRVLCPPTNIRTMRRLYKRFRNVRVEELRLNARDLNTKRMLELMAASTGSMPLYLHVVNRILRELRVAQQKTDTGFDYAAFKRKLAQEELTEAQLAPLKQRLETLESFMVETQAKEFDMFTTSSTGFSSSSRRRTAAPTTTAGEGGVSWTPQPGTLTIVDLSCPCVTAEMACSLFNICLSLFLEQPSQVGRMIALDEAHKYMNESAECQTLTEALLATIRLQRHLGARVVISTQEPTISPKLLDLCSVTVVHRFTSPDWLGVLRRHLAGVSSGARLLARAERMANGNNNAGEEEVEGLLEGVGAMGIGEGDPALELFSRIVGLRVGEALLFAPSAIVGVKRSGAGKEATVPAVLGSVKRLGHGVLKVRIRGRTTDDGGRSIMAA
ncbi:hypothetical protein B0T19DRAFT_77772 [Cercophora scortea]|uniref:P-loop containing nucleoside triphosphate hydrolase n=1 Tax=Cercophora scortea TaxID=314031 RepID=A0AAE0MMF1_9PEZI|nr:hypothetical protein B0T19DRAFT_77772 [Cercophora scortea]